jgi:hypothetical protein
MNVQSVSTAFPRNIKLKRKISYKGHYSFKSINPDHGLEAIIYLKAHNKWFEEVAIHESWLGENDDIYLIGSDESYDKYVKSNGSENGDDMSKNQNNGSSEGLPVGSRLELIDIGHGVLDINSTLCIAPATPQNIFTENGPDAMAFLSFLPDGQFSLYEARDHNHRKEPLP